MLDLAGFSTKKEGGNAMVEAEVAICSTHERVRCLMGRWFPVPSEIFSGLESRAGVFPALCDRCLAEVTRGDLLLAKAVFETQWENRYPT